jgi:3',5'-cyclic-AMP phosphodiesterase
MTLDDNTRGGAGDDGPLRDGSSLQIIQLTDCHLFTDPKTVLRGIVTWPRFQRVLEDIQREFPDVDLLIMTGDTAHDEQLATYESVREALGSWCDRLRIIPGNHDERAALTNVFRSACSSEGDRVVFELNRKGWQVIGLDSQIPGEVPGSLEHHQLDWLDSLLARTRELPTLLLVHHPPIQVNSLWLDRLRLRDADELATIVAAHPQVRLIGCGHVHQEAWGSLAGAAVMTTPAVGPPFRARTAELEIESRPPCYRWLELRADGNWRTQVISLREGENSP